SAGVYWHRGDAVPGAQAGAATAAAKARSRARTTGSGAAAFHYSTNAGATFCRKTRSDRFQEEASASAAGSRDQASQQRNSDDHRQRQLSRYVQQSWGGGDLVGFEEVQK